MVASDRIVQGRDGAGRRNLAHRRRRRLMMIRSAAWHNNFRVPCTPRESSAFLGSNRPVWQAAAKISATRLGSNVRENNRNEKQDLLKERSGYSLWLLYTGVIVIVCFDNLFWGTLTRLWAVPFEQYGETRQDGTAADIVDVVMIVSVFGVGCFLLVLFREFDADRKVLVQHGRTLHQACRDVLCQVAIGIGDLQHTGETTHVVAVLFVIVVAAVVVGSIARLATAFSDLFLL
jgi:hypothetical protein